MIPTPTTEQVSPAPVRDPSALDRSLVAGLAWSAGAKWSSQLISWASLVVVTRLLAPSDFGLVGMALVYCGLLQVITDAFGTAVTTLRDLTDEQLSQMNGLAVMTGVLASLVSCAFAIPLGHFFRSPNLPLVIVVSSSVCVISALRTVPYGLLYRDMRFKFLSIQVAIQTIAQALGMFVLAWLGFHYWALVYGNLISAVVLAGLQISARPYRFAWPRYGAMKGALTFSRHIMVSSLSWYGFTNADFLVAGRVLGQAALGAYTLAWTLATIPLEKVTVIVLNVSYSYFSSAQNDNAALRRYLRILTEGLAMVTFPATIGLALVAGDFIPLVFGSKWQGAIAPLEILAFYASFRCIVALLPSILNVTGDSRFAMRTSQAGLILMPTAFYLGSRWGAAGIAYGWVFAYPVIALCMYRRVFRRIEMPWWDYLETIRPAVTGCVAMSAAVETLKHVLPAGFPMSVRLGLEVLVGGAAFALILVALHRERFAAFWKFVSELRNPVAASAVDPGASRV